MPRGKALLARALQLRRAVSPDTRRDNDVAGEANQREQQLLQEVAIAKVVLVGLGADVHARRGQ